VRGATADLSTPLGPKTGQPALKRTAQLLCELNFRFGQDGAIDALQIMAHRQARLMKNCAVGIVHVAAAAWCGAEELTSDLRLVGLGADLLILAHAQSLLG